MELGWPLPKRREYLKEKSSEKVDKTHPVPFQGKMQYLPVHEVPIGLPLYRLENGRTTGKQAEYLSKHPEVSKDFFRSDTESAAAQKVQHGILTELARGPKNLFREFEEEPQIEPIILTSRGYVVNGNRRLSTWRDLYDSDKSKYKRFSDIQVVILTFVDDKSIDRVEAALQLKEDLKADYSWTSTALMMREKMDRFGYSEDELVALYTRDKKDLLELLDCLDYANQYLEARDIPNSYSEVDSKEYAFIQIVRTRKKWKATEPEKEVFEKAAFCLTDVADYIDTPNSFLFLDESHKIKRGFTGVIGNNLLSTSELPRTKLIMSGTPMPNDISDLVPQFRFLFPEIPADEDDVEEFIKPVYVRTTKDELGLPPVKHTIKRIALRPAQFSLYELLRSEAARQTSTISNRDRALLRRAGQSALRLMQLVTNPALLSRMQFEHGELLGEVLAEGDSPKLE